MAQYTTLSQQEIEAIASEFSIKNIHSFSILSGGSENTNYLLKSEKGDFVLTICEQKTAQKAKELALLLEYFEEQGFKSSIIIRNTRNEPISLWDKKPIMVKKFLKGKVIEDLPNRLLELIGSEIGKLHKIKAPKYLPTELAIGKDQFGEVKKYAPNSTFEAWLNEMLTYVSPYFEIELPKALNHTDIFSNNVIISEDESAATIMDFEEATFFYRVFDLGMTIIGACSDDKTINQEKVKHLLVGYTKEIQLLDKEVDALQAFTVYAGTTMTFWRHINFNYTVPDPNLSDHYLGLKVLTDCMFAQPSDYFHKIIEEITT
jgi:homoserine kinase type II